MTKQRTGPIVCALLAIATVALAQDRPPSTTAPVTWLIVIDDLHLDFRNTGRLRDMLKTLASELIRDGDQFAIASSGPSKIAVDVASDREVLTTSIKKATGNALKFEDMQSPQSSEEVRYRASITLATTQSMLSNATRLSGMKGLLFISNGLTYTAPNIMEQLTATARQSDVYIFAIDPRVAYKGTDLSAVFAVPGSWEDHVAAQHASLRSLSESAGGFAIVDGDLASQLQRIANAMRR